MRVINKGVLVTTEVGKFYLFKKPGHYTNLSLVVWGSNLCSTVGSTFTKEERDMIKLPLLQFSVVIGIILSDGYFVTTDRAINRSFRFKQSLDKSKYVWFVFSLFSHYCARLPYIVKSERLGRQTLALEFYTRILPCFKEIYSIFHYNGVKIIPLNIY